MICCVVLSGLRFVICCECVAWGFNVFACFVWVAMWCMVWCCLFCLRVCVMCLRVMYCEMLYGVLLLCFLLCASVNLGV